MAQQKKVTLTDEQARIITEQYNQLFTLAQQQLVEHKLWLVDMLRIEQAPTQLINSVQDIKLSFVTVEDGLREEVVTDQGETKEQKTVSIAFDYPDDLYAYMHSADAPQSIRQALQGAITLEDKPVVKKL